MAGRGIALYTDEQVYSALAPQLRRHGYDAVSAHEAGRVNQRISDPAQLAYATEHGRAILSNNSVDFAPLDARWKRRGRAHAGIMRYSGFPPIGDLLRRVIAHLDATEPATQHDTLRWLPSLTWTDAAPLLLPGPLVLDPGAPVKPDLCVRVRRVYRRVNAAPVGHSVSALVRWARPRSVRRRTWKRVHSMSSVAGDGERAGTQVSCAPAA